MSFLNKNPFDYFVSDFIEQIIHIPCKHQKERLYLLRQFTKDMRLCDDVRMEEVVRKLNGHVVRALKCVCQRAASIAILKGMSCVENVCFDRAIHYVGKKKTREDNFLVFRLCFVKTSDRLLLDQDPMWMLFEIR